jgi:hypothetical protein
MRRIAILTLASLLLAFTGAACGGDDDATTTTTTTKASDDGGDSGGSTGSDTAAGFLDEDCQFLLSGAFLNPIAATSSGTDPNFADASERLDAIADDAPDEIKDALTTLAEGFDRIAEVFKDVDLSDPSSFQDPKVASKLAELQDIADSDYQAAATEVSTWINENCTPGN